jgi:hypothetical protein
VIANAPGGLRLDRLPELEISNGIAAEIRCCSGGYHHARRVPRATPIGDGCAGAPLTRRNRNPRRRSSPSIPDRWHGT